MEECFRVLTSGVLTDGDSDDDDDDAVADIIRNLKAHLPADIFL
jgi:hypothetical protein